MLAPASVLGLAWLDLLGIALAALVVGGTVVAGRRGIRRSAPATAAQGSASMKQKDG
jgi:hypothetical protein